MEGRSCHVAAGRDASSARNDLPGCPSACERAVAPPAPAPAAAAVTDPSDSRPSTSSTPAQAAQHTSAHQPQEQAEPTAPTAEPEAKIRFHFHLSVSTHCIMGHLTFIHRSRSWPSRWKSQPTKKRWKKSWARPRSVCPRRRPGGDERRPPKAVLLPRRSRGRSIPAPIAANPCLLGTRSTVQGRPILPCC